VKSFFIRATNYKIAYFLSSSHFCGYIYLESVHKLTVSKKVVIPAKAGIQGSRWKPGPSLRDGSRLSSGRRLDAGSGPAWRKKSIYKQTL